MVKNLPAMLETQVGSLDWEEPLDKEMATHSSFLAWRIPMDRGAWWATFRVCVCVCVCLCAQSLQLCPTLCNPMDCSPPGFSVHGILQARTLEWVAMSSSRGSSCPRDQTCISCIACKFFTAEPPGKPSYSSWGLKRVGHD